MQIEGGTFPEEGLVVALTSAGAEALAPRLRRGAGVFSRLPRHGEQSMGLLGVDHIPMRILWMI